MAGVQPTGFLAKKTTKKDAWFGTFSPILDKEQGGYEALLGRPWSQPGWFMTRLIKKSQAGKRGMEGGKGLALFHRTKEISFP